MNPLGRRVEFDERSRSFGIRPLIGTSVAPRSYTWRNPIRLDQNKEPGPQARRDSCVGHAWTHEAAARPVQVPAMTHAVAMKVYDRAQALDSFADTPPEGGSSVLAGAKAAVEILGIVEYRWAFSLLDLTLAVGYTGPAVLGIDWHEGMWDVDKKGYVHATGPVVGGHAILCNRVNVTERFFGLSNSWGPGWGARDAWGLGGTCRVSFDDMEKLLDADGEACIPVRRRLP